MRSLILIALFLYCGGNAEVIRKSQVVPFVMGGSKVAFSLNGINTKDIQLKCVIRFSDGRDSIVLEPSHSLDEQSVICRLPPEINSGSVVVEIEATSNGSKGVGIQSTNVLLSDDVFINSDASAEVVVEENWDANQLTFTWDVEYFQQFFNPGATIMVQMTMYAADSLEPVFTETVSAQMIGMNAGTSTITVSIANINRISNIRHPYFYVLRPVGAPNVYMSSILFAPTLGMTDTDAERTCGLWLETAELPDEINPCPPCMCQIELDDNFIRSEYDPQLLRLANGALDNHVLFYERVPTNGGHAQTCSYDNSTRNLATTSTASWIHAVSKYRSYQENFFVDIWPYIVCCVQSNSQEFCDLFHEKRPIDTGHLYPGPGNPCCGWGDPHFVTFNNVKYDFMGNGEFWLIRGPKRSGFGVQGRMSPIRDGQQVTYFNAVAIKDGNTAVQLELRNYESFHLLVNGVEFPISEQPTTVPLKNAHIIINGNVVNIRLQTGFSVIVENIQNLYLNVYGSGAHRNKGKGFMGIFGNLGEDVQDDLTSQDGFVIPPTAANLADLSLMHHRFGLTWMTTANESLFVYENGKSWKDYANYDFGPMLQYPDPATMPEEVRAVCGDSLFCYYEYVGTGDLENAAAVVRIEDGLEELREEMRSVSRPMCDVIPSPANGRVSVTGHFNDSIATYSCNREFDFETGDRTRTCYASENESYWTGVEPACICKSTYVSSQQSSTFKSFFVLFLQGRAQRVKMIRISNSLMIQLIVQSFSFAPWVRGSHWNAHLTVLSIRKRSCAQ